MLDVVLGHALGAAHVVGNVHRSGAELLDGTGHAGDFAGLLLHPLTGTGGHSRQCLGTATDLLCRCANVLDHARQRFAHLVETVRQLADFIVARYPQTRLQVTATQGLRLLQQITQRAQTAA
ncbi:hypothetical protein D3C79_636160 [compost metagenome]